jgi:hypothetical protein
VEPFFKWIEQRLRIDRFFSGVLSMRRNRQRTSPSVASSQAIAWHYIPTGRVASDAFLILNIETLQTDHMTNKLIYQFRIALLEIDPPIWRHIQVPAEYSFRYLRVAIQDAMGWLDYHLYEYQIRKPRGREPVKIGIPDMEIDHDDLLPGWEAPISACFTAPGV